MPLQELVQGPNEICDDIQQTTFVDDVVPRSFCNNWREIIAAQCPGCHPFDIVVIGVGMEGIPFAEKANRIAATATCIFLWRTGACLLQIANPDSLIGCSESGLRTSALRNCHASFHW
jgi:hypothetical protein